MAPATALARLTPEEDIILWPDHLWPQDIGALVLLDGSKLFDRDGRFLIDKVRQVIAARLHLLPRFRQLLYVPPPRLGGPLWVDAPWFDLEDRVKVLELPPPADEAVLLAEVERLRRQRLSFSMPLWEIWFLTGLPERRVALFARLHHTIADGVAAVASISVFLDTDAEAAIVEPRPWTPAPQPTPAELRADHVQRRRQRRARLLTGLAHPAAAAQNLGKPWPIVRGLLGEKRLPTTSLDRVIGNERTLAIVRSRLDALKTVAHKHGAKVNDVFLAGIAGGLRELLLHRGEPIAGLMMRVYVPVSLRLDQRAEARGNLISDMAVTVPVGTSDPVTRLEQIAAETARLKARSHPSLGNVPHTGLAGRLMLMLFDRQRVNVVTADIPGPEFPLYLAGAHPGGVPSRQPAVEAVPRDRRDVLRGTVQHHGRRRP